MKYKYTFLKNRLFYDEILIPYLDRMSKKGWNLVSVNSFFKFEKSSVFLAETGFVPFPTRQSMLLSRAFDKSISCSGLGAVVPNSQFDMVCLVTLICSASFSCESPFCFLKSKIFFPSSTFISPFTEKYSILFLCKAAKVCRNLRKGF